MRCYDAHGQVHCLVEHGAVLERTDTGGARDRTSGCQNPALVASLLKKASKTGMSSMFPQASYLLLHADI